MRKLDDLYTEKNTQADKCPETLGNKGVQGICFVNTNCIAPVFVFQFYRVILKNFDI